MEGILVEIFLKVVNMSVLANYVILIVLCARAVLKKLPKVFSYSLWAVVFFRLAIPISFSSVLSVFNLFSIYFTPSAFNLMTTTTQKTKLLPKQVDIGSGAINEVINSALPPPTPLASIDPAQIILVLVALVWLLGVVAILVYSAINYARLKLKLSKAILLKDNLYESDQIQSAFVMGIIRPKIYMAKGFSETEKSYILAHERIHIKHFDPMIKWLSFLIVSVHWFNPLAWLSFVFMNKDMEMCCDEAVIRKMGMDIKKEYSSSLLSAAVQARGLATHQLFFGESNTKSRIKNVLNYKKPRFWAVLISFVFIMIMVIGLVTNPKSSSQDLSFLNIDNAASKAMQQEIIMIRYHARGASLIGGEEFGQWLYGVSQEWEEVKNTYGKKQLPTLTAYVSNVPGYKVSFYEDTPELATVQYEDNIRYYKIAPHNYQEVELMWGIRSYMIQDELVEAVTSGEITKSQSVNDVPSVNQWRHFEIRNLSYYLYEKNGRYFCESPYLFISEISKQVYDKAMKVLGPEEGEKSKDAFEDSGLKQQSLEISQELSEKIEQDLTLIMSSPKLSSNPADYIEKNALAYEDILKQGEQGLAYMLSRFEQGDAEGLRGQIMMRLCIELLGPRNNVTDSSLSPVEWFSKLKIRQKVELSDFEYTGDDPIEKLIYATELQHNKASNGAFTIIAPHIHGSYEEGNKLKVFVTTFAQSYILYDKTLTGEGGSAIPVAITYTKNIDGSYTLEKYEQAQDGSYFGSSIKEFCVMPVSGKSIIGLNTKIMWHYSNRDDIRMQERENLIQHLKANHQMGVSLYQAYQEEGKQYIPLT